MFSQDELEAIVLGSRWVTNQSDARLSTAARDALAKIAAVLPENLRNDLDASTLLVAPAHPAHPDTIDLAIIRKAIRSELKLDIMYGDVDGAASTRIIWPFALGFFDRVRVIVAWCELRQDFRHFRADRISAVQVTESRYPRRRQVLLKEWRSSQNIAEPL